MSLRQQAVSHRRGCDNAQRTLPENPRSVHTLPVVVAGRTCRPARLNASTQQQLFCVDLAQCCTVVVHMQCRTCWSMKRMSRQTASSLGAGKKASLTTWYEACLQATGLNTCLLVVALDGPVARAHAMSPASGCQKRHVLHRTEHNTSETHRGRDRRGPRPAALRTRRLGSYQRAATVLRRQCNAMCWTSTNLSPVLLLHLALQ
eukprot:COSAG02_NODE_2910_length_7766_cov_5.844659_3_plen_204_part_00